MDFIPGAHAPRLYDNAASRLRRGDLRRHRPEHKRNKKASLGDPSAPIQYSVFHHARAVVSFGICSEVLVAERLESV